MEVLLTEEQAAERLLISKPHLQRLCREGKIQFVQVTPRKRGFLPEHIDTYIQRKIIIPPETVDAPKSERVAYFPRSVETSGAMPGRAHLREEMRQWR
jgi:excisionase family DNA binding protein